MFYLRIAHDDEVQLPSCFTEAERRRIRGEAGEDKVVYDVVEDTIKASNMFSSATATIDVHTIEVIEVPSPPNNSINYKKESP